MPHFSALTWRIIAFNALALIVLTGGVIAVQTTGRGLVEERLNGVQQQAAIVASAIADYATDENNVLNVDVAEPLLRQLIAPTRLRARLYVPGATAPPLDTRLLLAPLKLDLKLVTILRLECMFKRLMRNDQTSALLVLISVNLLKVSKQSINLAARRTRTVKRVRQRAKNVASSNG